MTLISSLQARQGHGVHDEDEEAYVLGYHDAIRDAVIVLTHDPETTWPTAALIIAGLDRDHS